MTLTYPSLKAHLSRSGTAPAYVLVGEQDLLRELACQEIQEAVLGGERGPFNFDKFQGDVASAIEVVEACNVFPLLADRRLVLVKRAARLMQDSRSSVLGSYLDSPAPQTTLVLDLEKAPDSRRKAWREIEKKAVVVRCDPLRDREVEDWVHEQASRRGLALGVEEIRYLSVEFGSDLRRQLNELEKISLYAAGSPPSLNDLGALLGRGKARSVFEFTEAVANRDAGAALELLGRLLQEGESPLPLLALLDRVVGQLLTAKELRDGRQTARAAGELGVPGWKIDRLIRQSSRFTELELVRALEALARCDRAMKTTGVPAGLLLEGLVLSLCKGAAPKSARRAGSSSTRWADE